MPGHTRIHPLQQQQHPSKQQKPLTTDNGTAITLPEDATKIPPASPLATTGVSNQNPPKMVPQSPPPACTAGIELESEEGRCKQPEICEMGNGTHPPAQAATDVRPLSFTSTSSSSSTSSPSPPPSSSHINRFIGGGDHLTDDNDNDDDDGEERPLQNAVSLEEKQRRSIRRLCEAAQFCEAVGEVPPINEDEITREIIEDTSSDEDEDVEGSDTPPGPLAAAEGYDGDIDSDSNRPAAKKAPKEDKANAPREPASPPTRASDGSTSEPPKPPRSLLAASFLSFGQQLPPNPLQHSQHNFRGIAHNPPPVTIRGLSRGNNAQLHRKAWLEVSDSKHRYAPNLRLYYKRWVGLGHPTDMFFDWLDAKGAAANGEIPDLQECRRGVLDVDRVRYITDEEEQRTYRLTIDVGPDGSARILDAHDQTVHTGPNGWIFVLRDDELYGYKKSTSSDGDSGMRYRFHHSSFFGGKAVAGAGIMITNESGCLRFLYPHSGHYRPGEVDIQRTLLYFYNARVDLDSFFVDMQQVARVSREVRDEMTPRGFGGGGGGEKKVGKRKKVENLHLVKAMVVALFLGHKARCVGNGMFQQIHQVREEGAGMGVGDILDRVDGGGYWKRKC